MPWLWLAIAAVCEIAWAIGLKYTDGFTRPGPTLFTIPVMLASFLFLGLAVRDLPIGTAYAIWTGVGAVGIALIGIVYFQEPRSAIRLASIALIIVGIVGLKLTAPAPIPRPSAAELSAEPSAAPSESHLSNNGGMNR